MDRMCLPFYDKDVQRSILSSYPCNNGDFSFVPCLTLIGSHKYPSVFKPFKCLNATPFFLAFLFSTIKLWFSFFLLAPPLVYIFFFHLDSLNWLKEAHPAFPLVLPVFPPSEMCVLLLLFLLSHCLVHKNLQEGGNTSQVHTKNLHIVSRFLFGNFMSHFTLVKTEISLKYDFSWHCVNQTLVQFDHRDQSFCSLVQTLVCWSFHISQFGSDQIVVMFFRLLYWGKNVCVYNRRNLVNLPSTWKKR